VKKGDIVSIYEQPLTETKYEGEAKLVSFIKQLNSAVNYGVELWQVKFINDGMVVSRAIKTQEG